MPTAVFIHLFPLEEILRRCEQLKCFCRWEGLFNCWSFFVALSTVAPFCYLQLKGTGDLSAMTFLRICCICYHQLHSCVREIYSDNLGIFLEKRGTTIGKFIRGKIIFSYIYILGITIVCNVLISIVPTPQLNSYQRNALIEKPVCGSIMDENFFISLHMALCLLENCHFIQILIEDVSLLGSTYS